MAELKKTKQLAFVFLFYDLLTVLEDDDPRLRLGPPDGLPQTNFMVREATLFPAISQFSAGILQSHLLPGGVALVLAMSCIVRTTGCSFGSGRPWPPAARPFRPWSLSDGSTSNVTHWSDPSGKTPGYAV